MNEEIWRPIPGYGGHYEASDRGRIRSLDRVVLRTHPSSKRVERFHYKGRELSPVASGKYGHLVVHLGVDGQKFNPSVHGLVLLAFVGPRPDGMEACHNNGIASDNRAVNLRWDTHYNNNQDRRKHGTYAVGEKHPMAKLTAAQVADVRARSLSNNQIMGELGVHRTTAQNIRTGKTWAASDVDHQSAKARRRYDFNGESLTAGEIGRRIGLTPSAIYQRLRRGLPPAQAFQPKAA